MVLFFQFDKAKVSNGAQIFDFSYVVDILKEEPIISNVWQAFLISAMMVWGLSRVIKLANEYKVVNKSIYLALYFYHLGITSVYYYLTKNSLVFADARSYYFKAIKPDLISSFEVSFSFGTSFVVLITDFLVNTLGFNYLCCTMLFTTLGFFGILYFMKICLELGFNKSIKFFGMYLLPTILFLPNIHFWTSALGKDSLVFYAIMGFTYSLMNFRSRWFLSLFTAFIFLMLRPHIFIMAVGALVVTIIVFKKMNFLLKGIIVLFVGGAGLVFAEFFVRTRLGVGLNISDIIDLIDNQQGYYVGKSYSRTSLDLRGYPLPFKIFTYLYRPLFERFSVNFLILGVENLILLLLTMQLFTRKFFRWIWRADFIVKFCLIYTLIGTSVMGTALSNLGIATRQKTMFIYCLLVVIFAFMAYKEERKKLYSTKFRGNHIT